MSNNIDPEDVDPILDAAGGLRDDVEDTEVKSVLDPLAAFVKPRINIADAAIVDGTFTPQQVVAMSKLIEEATRKRIAEASYNSAMAGQVLPKDVVPITDFSKLSMDAVYDLSIPIEAKEFMSADALTVHLKDSNYEPRWVNKQKQNLSSKIAKGFTYVEPSDLQDGNEQSIMASLDAQGHYVFDDVVCMKIDKATYYKALRAAHLRALATTNEAKARERAAKSASAYMRSTDAASEFANASAQRKMVFYDPGIGA